MRISSDEAGPELKLAGSLVIGVAAELRTALHDRILQHPEVKLDLAGVESCDAAALQLLWSARKTAEETGKRLELTAMSPAVEDTGAALGLFLREVMPSIGKGLNPPTVDPVREGDESTI